jgi:hypothetical protein
MSDYWKRCPYCGSYYARDTARKRMTPAVIGLLVSLAVAGLVAVLWIIL